VIFHHHAGSKTTFKFKGRFHHVLETKAFVKGDRDFHVMYGDPDVLDFMDKVDFHSFLDLMQNTTF
jgi:hypothetical protein